ncbi:MAG: phosphoribosylamine--glycine ligase [Peptoniphilus grossensis]|uniref:phosphoribosylamine--glycine ligase n=1 Tax=Peptoniphilus grossensis TaxID=1465756 RepID=UPI0029081104|nr:phosphoribosylamine--glycine ligase [Peptoniphilus grossensis]MDU7150605.1 phosphoribosylamine--glycine ligase [Peptoniphilus grossensis]
MKVLVIGNGGREHALAWKLSESKNVDKIFMARGNGGTEDFCENLDLDPKDIHGLLKFAHEEKIDLTVVGPEDPLCMGIVDAFKEKGLKVFGPNKDCARFEKSKEFTKKFLEKYSIPTAKYKSFENYDHAIEGLSEFSYPLVVKADGLCLGKGVIICQNLEEAKDALHKIFKDKIFGDEGSTVVIEEFLTGEEASVLCLVSDNKLFPLERAKDHKQIFDGDKGPNTGGVGTYSPVAASPELEKNLQVIYRQIEDGLDKEKLTYSGILFIGFMIEEDKPKVLEFNVRFGDPETEVLMPRLDCDLFELLNKTIDGKLKEEDIKWKDETCLTVIMCSGGYPASYEKGKEISGLDDVDEDIIVFHNGTKKSDALYTNGGRVLSVTALGKNLEEARKKAYENVAKINFDGAYFRKDIGTK